MVQSLWRRFSTSEPYLPAAFRNARGRSINQSRREVLRLDGCTTGKSHYLPGLSDAAIEVITEKPGVSPPYSLTLVSHMGGATRRRSDAKTAFSGRDVYGESKYRRRSELKARYDPENVLRVNQNSKPE